jgi:uncharacterized protein (TIGR02594 family)
MMKIPGWLELAYDELGETEELGPLTNPQIEKYFSFTKYPFRNDEDPWCAAFVTYCLENSGIKSTKSASAKSYLNWGHELEEPRLGCVVVLARGNDPRFGHVGFFIKEDSITVDVLGGNQKNSVCVMKFLKNKILSYRWPKDYLPLSE